MQGAAYEAVVLHRECAATQQMQQDRLHRECAATQQMQQDRLAQRVKDADYD